MRRFWILAVGAVVAMANGARAADAAPGAGSAARPNIVFIFSDDHSTGAISAYGSKINQTPNIDRIAKDGMLFRNCLCTNSVCTPSRATILTGKFSHLNGVYNVGDRIDGTQQTFPKLLQKAGYQTAIVGKWHLGNGGISDPTGFDYWNILQGQGVYYNPPTIENGTRVPHSGYVADILTDITLDWLKNKRDASKPFMLMYHHKSPHRPWDPDGKHLTMYDGVTIPEPGNLFDDYANRASPARTQDMEIGKKLNQRDLKLDKGPPGMTPEQKAAWDAAYGPKNEAFKKANLSGADLVRWKYQRYIKDYLRCIASMDDNIGRVLKYLDDNGLSQNTVVIYSSDQGFYLGEHGWFDKRFMYEESLRQPLIVRWPGVVKAGSENSDLVSNLDFAETFLDMAGVGKPQDMQGESLVPLMKGEHPSDWRKEVYYHYYDFPAEHNVQRHYGVRNERYKLIYYYDVKEWELFDLQADPHEMKSVYDDPNYAKVRAELTAELKRLQAVYKDTNPDASLSEIDQKRMHGEPVRQRPKRPAARRGEDVPVERVLDLANTSAAIADGRPDVEGVPFAVGAVCAPESGDGVIVAQGGENSGYALYLAGGKPTFVIRNGKKLAQVASADALPLHRKSTVVGEVTREGEMRLVVDGKQVAEAAGALMDKLPAEGVSVGQDEETQVGQYAGTMPFNGTIQRVRVYRGVPGDAELQEWAGN